jgi:hypothetical protein
MEASIARANAKTEVKAQVATRSVAWKQFLVAVSKGLLMMDPMGYAWCWALTRDAGQ